MVGAATAAGISALGTLASSAISASNSKKLMKMQAALNYHYAKKSALNSPTWNRTGLEDAGYNPMLAVQNATSGTNSNWSGLNNAEAPDLSGAISSGIANAQSFKHLENETKQIESSVKANEATARNQNSQAANNEAENPFISRREEAGIKNTEAQTTKLESDTSLNNATIENLKSRLELDRQLGFAGLDVQRRGQDKALKGQIYNADSLAESMRGKVDMRFPFGIGGSRYYTPEERDFEFYNRSKEVRDKYKDKYR